MLSYLSFVLGIVVFFVYVVVEVIVGDMIGSFVLLLGVEKYSVMILYIMGCMVLGYFLGVLFILCVLL